MAEAGLILQSKFGEAAIAKMIVTPPAWIIVQYGCYGDCHSRSMADHKYSALLMRLSDLVKACAHALCDVGKALAVRWSPLDIPRAALNKLIFAF